MTEQLIAGRTITAAEIANILQVHKRVITRKAKREGWSHTQQSGRGGAKKAFIINDLPTSIKQALDLDNTPEPQRHKQPETIDSKGLWAWYAMQSAERKAKAKHRLEAVNAVVDGERAEEVAQRIKVAPVTLNLWLTEVRYQPRSDWLAILCPKTGKPTGRSSNIDSVFWQFVTSDWLRAEQPSLNACYRRAVLKAKAEGWAVPALPTLRRRINAEIPAEVIASRRGGAEVLKRLLPQMIRTKDHFAPLEAVNADGHTIDVMVDLADKGDPQFVCRPVLSVVQDLFSGKILSWRVDKTANASAVRLAFYDVFKDYGIPKLAFLDNGREYASKQITGGQATRNRFKVLPEEMPGVLTALGVKVHWTTPYHGQAKPIERAFRDFAGDIAKHPAFAGAYTGKDTSSKPHNYGSKFIERDEFLQIMGAAIAAHNAQPGRRSEVCGGRLSFDQVFVGGLADAAITKASEEQLRLVMLASKPVTVRRGNAEVGFNGWRFYASFLRQHMGQKVSLRFDPDNIAGGVHVYSAKGGYLGHSEPVRRGEFNSLAAEREHRRDINEQKRAIKIADAAAGRIDARKLAMSLPAPTAEVAATSKIVELAKVDERLASRAAPSVAAAEPKSAEWLAKQEQMAQAAEKKSSKKFDDNKVRFAKALALEDALASGGVLYEDDAVWLRNYQNSGEYKTLSKFIASIGREGTLGGVALPEISCERVKAAENSNNNIIQARFG